MERTLTQKERKELQNKLIQTLQTQINHLSTELQQILADDLITALQNRLTALTRIQTKQNPELYFESINHLYTAPQKQARGP